MTQSIGAIILAAGTSSRMGQLKQLLPLKGRPLLEHVIEKVLAENFNEIVTVVGYESEKIKKEILIENRRFRWILNEDFSTGQSSSLKKGIVSIDEKTSGIMVFLGDLPFCSQETIHSIYELGSEMLKLCQNSFVIQPVYKGNPGHPAFFGHVDKKLFFELEGDQGAKIIMDRIQVHKKLSVEDEGIQFDIDTPEAYSKAENLK